MFKSQAKRGFLICLVATVFVLVLTLFGWLDVLELKAIDFRFNFRGARAANMDIVIVDIDEKSIEGLGRWPWSRATHVNLIEKLRAGGAKVIAFDVLFTEPDLQNLQSDQAFADITAQKGDIVSAMFFKGGIQEIYGKDLALPYPALAESSYVGFVNHEPDSDGVTRHARLYAIEKNETAQETAVYPSFSVATLMRAREQNFDEIINELPIKLALEPELAKNDMLINFRPGYATDNSYPTYSYIDVLSGQVDPKEAFNGKIVLVGATATALFDLKAIPFSNQFPGVYTHANAIDNLISKDWLKKVYFGFTPVYVILIGLMLGLLLPRLSPWAQMGVFVVVVGGGIAVGLWLFSSFNLVLHMVPPLFTGLGCYGGILFYRLLIEEREKRKIKGSFKQYLSPKIIDVITKDPSKLKLGGEQREVTIFFLDIAGFTTMSEALNPHQLVEVMNQCLTKFSSIIMKHDGLINKYIGDCIMAFWNSPLDQPRHASLACLAALDCINALPELNDDFKKKGLPSIDCRIGINTGTVVVGNMGSNERFDYTVMGDPVNLASRLEGANKQYKTHIMISEETFEQAKEDIEARDIDLIRVKGKKEPKKVFEVICKKGQLTEQIINGRKKYHHALGLYRRSNFEEAIHAFQEVFDYLPKDHLTLAYLERARTFQITPPPANWDGVFEMKTK